jgi:hypothetical protein
VVLDFVARPPGWTSPSDLAPGWQDDQLVADVLAYLDTRPGESVSVLTGDAGVIATARAHGLEVVRPGETGWELPPEATPEVKELQKLRRENEDLRRTGPTIHGELHPAAAEPVDRVELRATWYPPLSDAEATRLVDEAVAARPQVTIFDRVPTGEPADPAEWELPTDDSVQTYDTAYAKWRQELGDFVRQVGCGSEGAAANLDVEIWLRNTGVEPADRTRLAIQVTGGFLLGDDPPQTDEDGQKVEPGAPADIFSGARPFRGPPLAPKPRRRPPSPKIKIGRTTLPDGFRSIAELTRQQTLLGGSAADLIRQQTLLGGSGMFDALRARGIIDPSPVVVTRPTIDLPKVMFPAYQPRNPHEFYWLTDSADRDGAEAWEFECEEYPHQADPEIFSFRLIAPPTEEAVRRGTLRLRVRARNLRMPYERIFGICFENTRADTVARVKSLLPL